MKSKRFSKLFIPLFIAMFLCAIGTFVSIGEVDAANVYDEWNPSTVYDTGDIVFHNNKYWIAGWYNVYQEPGTTGEWGVWKEYKDVNIPVVKPTIKPTFAPTDIPKITPTMGPSISPVSSATMVPSPKPTDSTYQSMIDRSLISTGNTYRINKAINKAMNGEDVTIAYIGGSITEGASATSNNKNYVYRSYSMFKERYGKGDGSNVHYINAGMSGTPSSLGVMRYERDVVNKAYSKPDIVFIEFAVNDADDVTNGDSYESLVRNVLNDENAPAVVLLFSVFESQWNLQDRFIPIGKDYNLPMISIKDAVVPEINSRRMTNRQFFAGDGWHPLDYGHGIMADCIMKMIDTSYYKPTSNEDIIIPSRATIGKSYEGIKMIDSLNIPSGVTINKGGFDYNDTDAGRFGFDNTLKFANTFKHTSNSGLQSFVMNVNCKSMLMSYKLSNNTRFGKADIYLGY